MAAVTVANVSFPFIEEDRHVTFLPLEALALAAALEAEGHEVDFRDYQQARFSDPQDPANAGSFFAGAARSVIITTPHDAMPVAVLLAERLKALDPDRTVIFGGYGPRHVAIPLLESFPFVDAVIGGSPELAAPRLASNGVEDWDKAPGVAFRDRDIICTTPPPASRTPLDRLPLPAYDKVDLGSYSEVMLLTAQGCPFRCAFCVRSGKLDEKSIDKVIHEVSVLRRTYGQKRIFFYDQTFALKKRRVLDLCRSLREAALTDVEWACTGRLNTTDVEMMSEMAGSGCRMIYFGMESGSDSVLERMKKRLTRGLAESAIRQAQRFFSVNVFFIWGFPFESMDDFRLTADMIRSLAAQGVAPIVYVLSPLPSSPLFAEYRDRLSFSREVWDTNWPVHLSNRASRDRVAGLIQAHPAVFPGFHVCDPNILEKLRIVRELGLETRYPDV